MGRTEMPINSVLGNGVDMHHSIWFSLLQAEFEMNSTRTAGNARLHDRFLCITGVLDRGNFAELFEVEDHITLSVGLKGRGEARSPHHFFEPVGVANVDRLKKSIVESLNGNQKLCLMFRQVFGTSAPKRAGFINGVDDGLGER
jgi:hypothetical protein